MPRFGQESWSDIDDVCVVRLLPSPGINRLRGWYRMIHEIELCYAAQSIPHYVHWGLFSSPRLFRYLFFRRIVSGTSFEREASRIHARLPPCTFTQHDILCTWLSAKMRWSTTHHWHIILTSGWAWFGTRQYERLRSSGRICSVVSDTLIQDGCALIIGLKRIFEMRTYPHILPRVTAKRGVYESDWYPGSQILLGIA